MKTKGTVIFTYENRTDANKKRLSNVGVKTVDVYRDKYYAIMKKTDDKIISILSNEYEIAGRALGNTVNLTNGDRISWNFI